MSPTYAIDTHCHLTMIPAAKREGVLERANRAGVKKMVTLAVNLRSIRENLALAQKHPNIWVGAGIHPTDLESDLERDLEKVFEVAKNDHKIVAIGEIGIDYYHDNFSKDRQMAYLAGQLRISKQLKKPAVLHCRAGKFAGENDSAFADLYALLKKEKISNAVMHCFSGNRAQARGALDMGLMLSFTGIITYGRNEELKAVVGETPMDRIMIETDAPFLPPKNHKGEMNEPAFVIEVAKAIAEIKSMNLDEVLRMTSKNAERFFGI